MKSIAIPITIPSLKIIADTNSYTAPINYCRYQYQYYKKNCNTDSNIIVSYIQYIRRRRWSDWAGVGTGGSVIA